MKLALRQQGPDDADLGRGGGGVSVEHGGVEIFGVRKLTPGEGLIGFAGGRGVDLAGEMFLGHREGRGQQKAGSGFVLVCSGFVPALLAFHPDQTARKWSTRG